MAKKQLQRTSAGLRDILFDEIEQMRSGSGDAARAMSVASLAKQIVSTAKVELEFHRVISEMEGTPRPLQLGTLQLGG